MRFVVAFLLLASSAVHAHGIVAGNELMRKMVNYADKINYQGTFVFVHGGQMDSMKIIHGVSGGEVREKLTSLSGEPREVLRDDETVTCVWPNRKLVTVESTASNHSIPTIIPKKLEGVEQNYIVATGKIQQIAGQDCRNLTIRPIDYYRYGYELCIQPETGMLLRSKMFHPKEGLLEEVMFTSLQYLDQVDSHVFELANNIEGYTWRKPNDPTELIGDNLITDASWGVSKLPPGFSIHKISRRLMSTSDEPVHHMVVSDGYASVSVFIIKPRNADEMQEGPSRYGSINTYSRGFNDHQITVMGEVPIATVEMIGTSIMYEGN